MRTVTSRGGVDVALYDDTGSALPPAVIAHGVGSSARFVTEAFEGPLEAAGYRLVTYDLRGHGRSTPVPQRFAHTLDHHAADLGAVATAVGARLVGGISIGAHVAVRWAAREQAALDGVVACLPVWTGVALPGEGPYAAVAAAVIEGGAQRLHDAIRDDPDLPDWLRDVGLRDLPTNDPDSLVAMLVALDGGEAPGGADLEGLRAPLGLAAWPDDPGHPARVAQVWSLTAPRAALRLTSIEEVGRDREALGRAALDALDLARNAA